ncbi:MAG: ROK family protein [Kiritimatiellae bacterium]|nr:ROK family protein [Kiritimatiellia bacterium]MDD5521426.1 ROK family protein [Kiritimatiellia bacterium]
MKENLSVNPKIKPVLDPDFTPAVLWNRAYRSEVKKSGKPIKMAIALEQRPDSRSVYRTEVLPAGHPLESLNRRYVERLVKFLLWQKGGWRILISGDKSTADYVSTVYSPKGERKFDSELIGEKVYGHPIQVTACSENEIPAENETAVSLGRHLNGCRIGFDLGGSDRKCAAVIDGKVVFSEEVAWDPYFQKDPQYHWDGINDTLKRAAAKLPKVDAIGGSAAGIYVNNEVRVASLFRGVPADVFKNKVRGMFLELKKQWKVPFEVVNDGEVTALAGSMSINENAVLGISMGTSLAAGYVTPDGCITQWLNELAFVPVDYRLDAPKDEWSGDGGCGVQYFSQQAVGRLCKPAGIDLPAGMPLAEKLVEVQKLMKAGDPRAVKIYETIGVYFGYAVAHFADFYNIKNILLLGRVMSGQGGEIIISKAKDVLKTEFRELCDGIKFRIPDEKEKRHGQAVAAASLPAL